MERDMSNVGEDLMEIAERTKEILGEECYVDVRAVYSCGIAQPGIVIMPLKGQPCMSTVVGINDMAGYGWDITEPDECARELVKMFEENMELLESCGFTKECVVWEKVKGLLYPVLMPLKGNGEILSELVYRKELDFAVAYMVRVKPDEERPWMLVKITKSMFDLWSISKKELHGIAMENLRKEGLAVVEHKRLADSGYVISPEDAAPKGELETGKIYVLSNSTMYYGAAAILDMELLKMLSGGGELYILPIDIHSVLVIKDDKVQEPYCNEAVSMWSGPDSGDTAKFTDHAYCYDGEKNELHGCYG